ncbi:MAG TPA: cysteine desulfurase family protein [Candidatus Paceibacterota bacterium]|nr:cysteine desulfurase family protein [Candidatus Paceibacterota bacterium]HPT18180.1 cysteine desulfurase family protein [Candidatus Paceibacterota bacterium]
MKKSKEIYLDYASSTPIEKRVVSAMNHIINNNFANPSAIHELGLKSKEILNNVRSNIADILEVRPKEIIFTSGATENNNLAVLGIFQKTHFNFFPHIVTTNIEHPSVIEVCKYLEETKQAEVTYVNVEPDGIVDPKKISKALKKNTVLVAIMYANNEIGTIQPIKEIAKEIRHFKKMQIDTLLKKDNTMSSPIFPIFYVDATQAVNYLPISVPKLGVDMMSFNGDKIYGPKDIGVFYSRNNIPLGKIFFGGDQEFGKRPGTENLASIVGLDEALKIVGKIKINENKRLINLRNYFIKQLTNSKTFKKYGILLNGSLENRLPNNINITIPKIPSDLLLVELSANGIYVSEKSACKSGDKKSSHVINAICNISESNSSNKESNSLRFSLGRSTTKDDLNYTLKVLASTLKKLEKWYC